MSVSTYKKREIPDIDQQPDIVCDVCNKPYRHRRNLYAHIRKFHGEEGFSLKGNQFCGICHEGFRRQSYLHEHLKTLHDVKLNFVVRTFYAETDFLEWKTKIEEESKSTFVLNSQIQKKDTTVRFLYYKCHRSGFSNIKGNRKCEIKTLESNKIGSMTCPAIIKVTKQISNDICEIKVNYQSVHVGHEMQVGTIQLITEEETASDGIINVPEERNKRSPVHCTLGPVEKNKFELMKNNYKTKCISNSKKVFEEESSLVDKEVINKESSLVDKREINVKLSPVDNEEINAAAEINKQTPVDCIPRSVQKNKRKPKFELPKNNETKKVKCFSNSNILNKESAIMSNLRHSNRLLKNSLYNKNKRIERLNKQLSELKTKVKYYESGHHHFSFENMHCRSESSEKPIFILQQIKPKTPSNTKRKTPSNTKCKSA